MAQAPVYVSNWTGYRLFQEALKAARWRHSPTLRAYLPQGNGGRCPPWPPPGAGRTAAVHQPDPPGHPHLPGVQGDRRTAERPCARLPGRVHLRWRAGQGRRRGPGRPVRGRYQRAAAARGVPVPAMQPGGDRRHAGRERQAGTADRRPHRQVGHRALSDVITRPGADPDPTRYPRLLCVAADPRTAREFAAIVQALEQVLRAAIETGNPVIWG